MTLTSLLIAMALALPDPDPVKGNTIGGEEFQLLPSADNLAWLGDIYFLEIMNQEPGGGGIAAFDAVHISTHGWSWRQFKLTVDEMDWNDPANSGLPVMHIPQIAWSTLTHHPFLRGAPTLDYQLHKATDSTLRFRLRGGQEIGGATWVPERLMDREPGTVAGADPNRRALTGAHEMSILGTGVGDYGQVTMVADVKSHAHTYPTLISTQDGESLTDYAERQTLMAFGDAKVLGNAIRFTLGYERIDRDYEGAQYRHPSWLTHEKHQNAFIANAQTTLDLGQLGSLHLGLGTSFMDTITTPNSLTPQVKDIETEWLWLARPVFAGTLQRFGLNGLARWTPEFDFPLEFLAKAHFANIKKSSFIPGDVSGETLDRGTTWAAEPVGARITVWDPSQEADYSMMGTRLIAKTHKSFEDSTLSLDGGLDFSMVRAASQTQLSFISPVIDLVYRKKIGEGAFFALVGREPEAITANVAEFLDPNYANANVYTWVDDGDGVPQADEAGTLLRRSGGEYHALDEALKRPSSNHFAFGYEGLRWGPMQVRVGGVGRWLIDRQTVVYNDEVQDSYKETIFDDPGGVGWHGLETDGTGGEVTVYEREAGTEGEEIYVLTNAERPDFFLGAEIGLFTVDPSWWFFSLGLAGYWDIGEGAFGLYADRNDSGAIVEETADPNTSINAYGRFDHDRSFTINLIAGLIPFEGLSGAIAARYRDGQPITRFVIVEDLAQGPTLIMTEARGAPVPRHTFHMTFDARLRYELDLQPLAAVFTLDLFNIFGSGTELIEDTRTGRWRTSLEMNPNRTVMAGLELGWK